MSPYGDYPMGFWQQIRDDLEVRANITIDHQSNANLPAIVHLDIKNISSSEPDVVFDDIQLRIGKSPDWHIEKFNGLESGQGITFEYRCSYLDLPDITYDIKWKVNIEKLFTFDRGQREQKLLRPSDLSLLDYLRSTNELRPHRWLDEVLQKIPELDSNMTLAEIEKLQNKIGEAVSEIRDIQKRVSYLFSEIGKEHRDEITSLSKLVREYLKTTEEQCISIKESLGAPVLSSSNSLKNSIRVLEAAGSNVNKKIEEMMEKNGISDQDASYQYRNW